MTPVLLIHAAVTLAMTGLIWFIQLVHYPLFGYAEGERFRRFEAAHQRRTSWVVVPLMSTEAVTAGILLWSPTRSLSTWIAWALLVSIWLFTSWVQVPLHRRLSAGFDAEVVRRLVLTNWWRTIAWTLRGGLALWLLIESFGG